MSESKATAVIEGDLSAKGRRFAIITARFNSFIVERLLEGAMDCLIRNGASAGDITVIKVPGAFEIPMAAMKLADSDKHDFDGIICLGAVIRGSTPHFDYVSAEVSKGIASASMETMVPIGFGVLTCDTVEQAIDRAGAKAGNKGWETAQTVVEMINLFEQL